MAYRVRITPGKDIVLPEELDGALKSGCDEAARHGANIYVCGGNGCGKSSVLEYFKCKAKDYFGVDDSEILFMSDFDFVDKIIYGIRNNEIEDFRKTYSNAKLIIIDDIDRFKDKDVTQCEFRHILETNKRIIVSGTNEVDSLPLSEDIICKIKHFTIMQIDNISEET